MPENIADARRKSGDTVIEAAARLSVDRSTWWRWENGEREMDAASWELYLIKTGQLKP